MYCSVHSWSFSKQVFVRHRAYEVEVSPLCGADEAIYNFHHNVEIQAKVSIDNEALVPLLWCCSSTAQGFVLCCATNGLWKKNSSCHSWSGCCWIPATFQVHMPIIIQSSYDFFRRLFLLTKNKKGYVVKSCLPIVMQFLNQYWVRTANQSLTRQYEKKLEFPMSKKITPMLPCPSFAPRELLTKRKLHGVTSVFVSV